MKTSLKKEIMAFLPSVDILAAGMTSPEGVIACRNLRPATGNNGKLTPVEDFAAIATDMRGARILGSLIHPLLGRSVIVARGNKLLAVTATETGSNATTTVEVGTLDEQPRAIVTVSSTLAHVMTTTGVYTLEAVDDGFSLCLNHDPDFLPRIEVESEVSVETTVAQARLRHEYGRSDTALTSLDARLLAAELRLAAAGLVDKISHAGGYALPVPVRYRLVDANGRDIYVSPVKLMAATGGAPFLKRLSCSVQGKTRGSFNLEATMFKIGITLPEANDHWSRRVAALLVESAPGVPVIDTASTTVENRLDADSTQLNFYMPGASVDLTPDRACVETAAVLLLRRFDEMATQVCRIDDPYGAMAGAHVALTPHLLSAVSPMRSSALTPGRLQTPAARNDSQALLRSLRLPHRFTAGVGCINGDTALLAAVKRVPAKGWNPTEWFHTSGHEGWWRACVVVEMAGDRRRAVYEAAGTSKPPVSLAPLLYYPSEQARALEVRVNTARGTATARVELQAVPGAGMAVAVAAWLAPITLVYDAETRFVVPAHNLEPEDCEGVLLSAPATDALNPVDARLTAEGTVVAATPATATTSVWEFARQRFYIFGSTGTSMVATDSHKAIAAVQRLDHRAVISPAHVAVNPAQGTVSAIAANELINVRGTAVHHVPVNLPAGTFALACDHADLWIAHPSGATVLPGSAPGYFYTRSTPPLVSLFSESDGRMTLIDSLGQLLDASRRYVADKDVEWSCRIALGNDPKPRVRGAVATVARLTAVGLRLVCSALKARLVATADYGSTAEVLARVLLNAILEGALKNTLVLPLRAPACNYVTLTLTGTLSADADLCGVALHFKS